jgi:hypothetical protein
MCDYEGDGAPQTRINQGLYASARRIERQMTGAPASEAAWNVFFGRAAGVIVWSDYQRITRSYVKAERGAQISNISLRQPMASFLCDVAEPD